jgi:DNA-binding FadR family transcriptional regulator
VSIFELATCRADNSSRDRVAELARKFERDLRIDEFRRLDREFHTTIAASCANPFLLELYGKVLDQLFKSHEFDALLNDEKNRPEVRQIVKNASAAHQQIAAAFVAGDVEAMSAAAQAHLASVEHGMVDDLL